MKKSIISILITLVLFGLTACGKLQLSEEKTASVSTENSEADSLEETTMAAVAETEPAVLYPQIPGKNAEVFLKEMNETLEAWGIPYTLESDPSFYGRQQTKHHFLLRSEEGELLPDSGEYSIDTKGAYHNEGTIYSTNVTCFPTASDAFKEVYPHLCAALSVVMDPEITREQAYSIFNMEPTYQGETFTRYQYDTFSKIHALDRSYDPSAPDVIRFGYSVFDTDYWDVAYTINQQMSLDPVYLEYDFNYDPCREGELFLWFGNEDGSVKKSSTNFYVPYLEDLNLGFLVENYSSYEPGKYTLRDKSGTMTFLTEDIFLITERSFGNEAGSRYLRIYCNPGALNQEMLKAANSALNANPHHLFRPVIGMVQLCDPGMNAEEAMNLVMGTIPTAVQEKGLEYLFYCPRNAAFVIRRDPNTGAFEMTIMTKACYDRFFGTCEEYFKNYTILDNPFLEGFD